MSQRRIVVTGLGVVSPCGQSPAEVWDAVSNGRATAATVTRFDSTQMPCHLAAEIKDFRPELWMEKRRAARLDRAVRYCLAAGKQAFKDSGLEAERVSPDGWRSSRGPP